MGAEPLNHRAWNTSLQMPAAIHRTCYGQGVRLGFGDRHTLAGQQCDRHVQLFIGDDFDVRAFAFDAQVFADEGAAAGAFFDFDPLLPRDRSQHYSSMLSLHYSKRNLFLALFPAWGRYGSL